MAELNVGVEHDIAHFAVETILGFQQAFYGLVAGGMNIADFNVAAADKTLRLPHEAIWAEFIVGLLQLELAAGEPFVDFNAQLLRALANSRKPLPTPKTIGEETLAAIRSLINDLLRRWAETPQGGTLELQFEMPKTI